MICSEIEIALLSSVHRPLFQSLSLDLIVGDGAQLRPLKTRRA